MNRRIPTFTVSIGLSQSTSAVLGRCKIGASDLKLPQSPSMSKLVRTENIWT